MPDPEWSTRWPGGYAGKCATCGWVHDVAHAWTQRVHGDGQECAVQAQDWPYECDAKDKYQDHEVYRCAVHGVWWHEPGAMAVTGTSEDFTGHAMYQQAMDRFASEHFAAWLCRRCPWGAVDMLAARGEYLAGDLASLKHYPPCKVTGPVAGACYLCREQLDADAAGLLGGRDGQVYAVEVHWRCVHYIRMAQGLYKPPAPGR